MAYFKHTPEQIQKFKVIFDQLTTIEEKLAFWKNTLGIPFSFYTLLMDSDQFNVDEELVTVFYFNPPRGEQEKLNWLMLEEIQEYDSIRPKKLLLHYESLKTALDEKISGSKRPVASLEKELIVVNETVEENKAKEIVFAAPFDLNQMKKQQEKNIWTLGYEDSYLYGKDLDLTRLSHDATTLAAYHNGFYTGTLKAYIEEKIKNPAIKKVSAAIKETTLKQQLLLLRFTGLLDNIKDWKAKDKSKFLAVLLNRNEKNIETALATLYYDKRTYETWTPTNLAFLVEKLSAIGLTGEAEEIKQELDKLQANKSR